MPTEWSTLQIPLGSDREKSTRAIAGGEGFLERMGLEPCITFLHSHYTYKDFTFT